MHANRKHFDFIGTLTWLVLALVIVRPNVAAGSVEETFDVLQIGTHSYTNVTVTSKAKNYIIILHSAGMTSLKVADLPGDLQQKLGYLKTAVPGAARKADPRNIVPWAKKTIARADGPQLKRAEQMWRDHTQGSIPKLTSMNPKLLYAALGIGVLAYLLCCQCGRLICLKAGVKPGVLVWLPVVQIFPLLSAAGMSPLWFFLCLVPGLGLVVQIIWSIKIVKKCDKSPWFAFLLIMPGLNLFGFLYLAFSSAEPADEPKKTGSQTMVFEGA